MELIIEWNWMELSILTKGTEYNLLVKCENVLQHAESNHKPKNCRHVNDDD